MTSTPTLPATLPRRSNPCGRRLRECLRGDDSRRFADIADIYEHSGGLVRCRACRALPWRGGSAAIEPLPPGYAR